MFHFEAKVCYVARICRLQEPVLAVALNGPVRKAKSMVMMMQTSLVKMEQHQPTVLRGRDARE
jgi:hypothetical protein